MLSVARKIPPFDPSAGPPGYTYVKLADYLEALIRGGELAAGAMLPGERALAEQHGVAIGTARRAVAELRARNLVITLPGKGSYVAATG